MHQTDFHSFLLCPQRLPAYELRASHQSAERTYWLEIETSLTRDQTKCGGYRDFLHDSPFKGGEKLE
jgi:hypothetical protein